MENVEIHKNETDLLKEEIVKRIIFEKYKLDE